MLRHIRIVTRADQLMKLNVKIRITVLAVVVIAFFVLNSTCVGSTIHPY